MRLSLTRSLVLAGLTVALATSCAKPKKVDDGTDGGAGGAGGTPAVTDTPIGFDPQGSDSGKISGLNTIFFEYDQARLTNEARKTLTDNANWIKSNSKSTVQIEGHTDERGSVEYNLALGERRAKSVKTFLEGLGVDSKRMTIISYGEEKPLSPGHDDSAWSKNRRANFVPLQ
jgi:peptidoglycan-associated lipoprotein